MQRCDSAPALQPAHLVRRPVRRVDGREEGRVRSHGLGEEERLDLRPRLRAGGRVTHTFMWPRPHPPAHLRVDLLDGPVRDDLVHLALRAKVLDDGRRLAHVRREALLDRLDVVVRPPGRLPCGHGGRGRGAGRGLPRGHASSTSPRSRSRASMTASGHSYTSTPSTVAELPITRNHPSRLFSLRGKPSMRKRVAPDLAIAVLISSTVVSTGTILPSLMNSLIMSARGPPAARCKRMVGATRRQRRSKCAKTGRQRAGIAPRRAAGHPQRGGRSHSPQRGARTACPCRRRGRRGRRGRGVQASALQAPPQRQRPFRETERKRMRRGGSSAARRGGGALSGPGAAAEASALGYGGFSSRPLCSRPAGGAFPASCTRQRRRRDARSMARAATH